MNSNSAVLPVTVGAIVGGGVLFGLCKAFNGKTGWLIVLTIVGASVGGFVGYEAVKG